MIRTSNSKKQERLKSVYFPDGLQNLTDKGLGLKPELVKLWFKSRTTEPRLRHQRLTYIKRTVKVNMTMSDIS